jgi:hypothetical protein
MKTANRYGKRSKSFQKLRMDLINGPSQKVLEAWSLTDSEIKFLKNCKLMVGEGGPSNYHQLKKV